jgi:dual specificity protein kinase YAK1
MNVISSFEIQEHVCLLMPLCGRSLFMGLGPLERPRTHLQKVRSIMVQLLQALDFVHALGIIHADIKPDNLLFCNDDNDEVVLIDFGSAMSDTDGQRFYIQSRFYRSPEVILGIPYDDAIDVWSAGCIAAELYVDFPIFACETESDCIHAMVALLGMFPTSLIRTSRRWQRFFQMTRDGFVPKDDPADVLLNRHCSREIFQALGIMSLEELIREKEPATDEAEAASLASFSDFVRRLLAYSPNRRITAGQALRHPFILDVPLPPDWQPQPDRHRPSAALRPPAIMAVALSADLPTLNLLDLLA